MSNLQEVIAALGPRFVSISDDIWDFAEMGFNEVKSSARQAETLAALGFRIEKGLGGMETAFVAEKGSGGPIIGFLGEFDALANLSQTANIAEQTSQTPGANGHGCGHNLLGTGSMLAAGGLAQALEDQGMAGTVRYYACPAEEGGSGKSFMARAGCFDDLDVAFTWHPAPFNGVRSTENLAVTSIDYRFTGRAAHASNGPHLGRSALDALELMNVGVNFLREHIPTDCRIHYSITDTGGSSPNVVQATAASYYYVRSPSLPQVLELTERVHNVARGAAMMTDTSVEISVRRSTSNLLPNHALENALHATMLDLGPVPFDNADLEFAARIRETLTEEMVSSSLRLYNVKGDALLNGFDATSPLHRGVLAFDGTSHFRAGSTDVGEVSWVVPTAQVWTPCWAIGTPVHSWQVVAQGKSPAAHKAMIHAASTLATTALRLVRDPSLIEAAHKEWKARTGGKAYVCPLPEDAQPPAPEKAEPATA